MPTKPNVSAVLLDARSRAGLTQRELARRAGTQQSVVARIESGLTSPSTGTLDRLLKAAGFELVVGIQPIALLDPQLLDDVPRIRRLSPENRLREVANVNRLAAAARPV